MRECVYAHANSHLLSEKGSDGRSETHGENNVLKQTEIGGGGKKRKNLAFDVACAMVPHFNESVANAGLACACTCSDHLWCERRAIRHCSPVCCSVLQCVAVYFCSVLLRL